MGAPGMTSPIRAAAFNNLQLNAGILLANFDHSQYTTQDALKSAIQALRAANSEKLLGCTNGGGRFTVTPERRKPEIDGVRYPFKGGEFIDSMDARLSATTVEVNPVNWKRFFGSADLDTSVATKIKLTVRTAINPETDYLDTVCWVGDLADGRYVLIELYNALNTADFDFTFKDKGEGQLPYEFHAHQSDVLDYDEAPFAVYFLAPSGSLASMTVTSAAGTAVGGTAITTNHTLTASETYVYKFDTNAPAIGYLEQPDYTWTVWDGSSEIAVGAAANGKKITVAVLNSQGQATISGSTTLAVKTA